MAQLAIKGHKTRGSEVIEILEMFGGRNDINYVGELPNYVYTINERGIIDWYVQYEHNSFQYNTFTLEEFLKKFPYKIGDKVQHKGATSYGSIFEVEKMQWEDEKVKYIIRYLGGNYDGVSTVTAEDLQPYKEKTAEKTAEEIDEEKAVNHVFNTEVISFDIAQRDKYELDLQGKFHVVLREGKYYVERIKPRYPKTYEECCDILQLEYTFELKDLTIDEEKLMDSFIRLKRCRDAYWKIAGRQMGLCKPWEPDWVESDERKYCIGIIRGNLILWEQQTTSKILAFPIEEMRDAFYENFKELIEECKELL